MTYTKDNIVFQPIPSSKFGSGKDLTGNIFGRLTVIGFAERQRNSNGNGGRWFWWCECLCGNITKVDGYQLKKGTSKSCGCLRKELMADKQRTHGRSQDTIYAIWRAMIQRCTNPNVKEFHYYGERGITVCERWLKFENFLADMGERPDELTLERRENNGNYEPSNCYWGTIIQQRNNMRNNHPLTFNGKTQNVTQWANELGCSPKTLFSRLYKGKDTETTLTTPIKIIARKPSLA